MSNRYGTYDNYGLRHLPQHLIRTGRGGRLREMLFEFDWLQTKLDITEATALLADYELLPGDEALRLVQGALRLSAHVLASDKSQFASRLTGRLLSSEAAGIRAFLKGIRESKKGPWLRPLTLSFTPPGDLLLFTLAGDAGPVYAVAVTPDGKRAVSRQSDTLHVWDLEHGTMLSSVQASRGLDNSLAVTSDGRRAILGLRKSLEVYDLEGGTYLATLEGHTEEVTALAVTPDGKRAISASKDETLKVWDLERGMELATLQRDQSVAALAVTLDGKRAVSAGDTLKVWDLEGGKELATLEGHKLEGHQLKIHTGSAYQVAVTPDGCYAVSGNWDTLTLWDLKSGKEISRLRDYRATVTAVAVTPDGKRAVSGGSSYEPLKVWDLESGRKLATLEGHTEEVTAVVITLDGKRAISASKDETLKVWDLEGNMELATQEGHTGTVTALAVTPDGKRAIFGQGYHILKVWDLEHGTELATLGADMTDILAFMKLDLEHGTKLTPLEAQRIAERVRPALVTAVTVTPDGRRAVSGSQDNTLKVWDLDKGTELATFRGHAKSVTAVAVTPDGKRAVSGSQDNTLKVWDLDSGVEIATLRGHAKSVRAVAVTPDGKRAVSGSQDDTLKVWDLERGMELATLQGHTSWVSAVSVTPDGRRAVSGSLDSTLRIWDLEGGTELATLEGHTKPVESVSLHTLVTAVRVTPDGRYAVSVSDDTTIKLWDLDSLKTVATFTGDSGMDTCEIAADGSTIIAGDRLARVHVLRLENVVSGPFIVTAWRFSTRILILKRESYAFGCPHCRTWSKISASAIGTEVACPNCRAQIKLNPFTINADWRPIARAWKSPSKEKPFVMNKL